MKIVIFILLFLSGFQTKGQNNDISGFSKSFGRIFKVPYRIIENEPKHYFFSVRFTTNETGEIVSYEYSLSTDSILIKNLKESFDKFDKKGLIGFDLKNANIILPVYILNDTPGAIIDYKSTIFDTIWEFENEINTGNVKLLPPAVIYYRKGVGIVN